MTGPVFLDHASTTPVDPRVREVMMQVLREDGTPGNAASVGHAHGDAARAVIEDARAQVASAVGCEHQEIVWTSGATEADNLAILGVARYYQSKGRHLVTSRTEHKAVLDPCRELERLGWSVTYLTPEGDGRVTAAAVAAAIRADTVLVSLMHVNNETGVVQDIEAIASVCNARGTPLHVDAAQSVGKRRLRLRDAGVALASLSAHKAYGPKGVGALAILRTRGVHLAPLFFGGGQEDGLRPGTLATHQIAAMGAAFALSDSELEADCARIAGLRERLSASLMGLGGVLLNGDPAHSVPHIVNLSFEGVEGESLIAELRDRISVSTGSACTSATQEPSYVLRALGRDDQLAQSSLRFGIGRMTRESDIDVAIDSVSSAVRRLRRIADY